MTTSELLQFIRDLHTPEADHDPQRWERLMADVDGGLAHE